MDFSSGAQVTVSGTSYCEVKGEQPPQLQFDLRLPVAACTGRYVQEGNELALATDNEGHVGFNGFDAPWAADPAMRISYACTSEHNLEPNFPSVMTTSRIFPSLVTTFAPDLSVLSPRK